MSEANSAKSNYINLISFTAFCVRLRYFKFIFKIKETNFRAANDFDILVFAQQWPKSTCVKSRRTQNQCNIPNNDDWTVHGIWPSKSGQNGPEDCIRNFPLQVQNLNTIRPQLEARWLNVLNNNPVPFWNHEWQKHGTCSVVLPALDSQFKYFNKGLEWNNDYRIGNILRDSNITPGRNYPLANILRALHQGLGVDPQVSCFRDGVSFIRPLT